MTNNTFGVLIVIGDKTKIKKKTHFYFFKKHQRTHRFYDFYATEICNANKKEFFEVIPKENFVEDHLKS